MSTATKVIAVAALASSAAAFAPTAAFKPALRSGATSVSMAMDKSAAAPVVQIFDHRGCSRAPKEYTGKRANGAEDEMMVKVGMEKIVTPEQKASKILEGTLPILKSK